MEYKIVWSPKAKQNYIEVIDYLFENWPSRVVENFILKTEETLHRVTEKPYTFRESITSGFREVFITKHNLMVYRIEKNMIQIVILWDTRRNPKMKYHKIKGGVRTIASKRRREQ